MFSGIFGGGAGGRSGSESRAILSQVRGYWEGLRRGAALPRRALIDPRGIEGALETAFLLERIAPGHAKFRLAGMHLADLMTMDVRGMPVSAMFYPPARPRLNDVLEQVFGTPGIGEMTLEAESGLGRPPLTARMLLLPVAGEREAPLAFGCLVSEGGIGRGPRRFHITRAVVETLPAPPVARAPVTPAKPPLGLAEPPAAFVPPPRAKPGRAHLRLVKG